MSASSAPVHSLPLNAHRQRVQRLMRAATGTEPVREALEIDLIDLVEDPSLPSLRGRLPSLVRLVPRYNDTVRLLRHVRVRIAACGLRGPALIVRPRRARDLPVLAKLADIVFGAVFLFIGLVACSIAAIRPRSGVRLLLRLRSSCFLC